MSVVCFRGWGEGGLLLVEGSYRVLRMCIVDMF